MMRRSLSTLLAILAIPAFAADESAVPLKPFRTAPVPNNYTVVEGDTLYSIARKFGRDPKLIHWLNRLENADALPVGKVLFIGDATVAR